jgi:DNA polymerase I-like protein with 3'-5' exonuclease and polymerase domains/intein/homing endonuclease
MNFKYIKYDYPIPANIASKETYPFNVSLPISSSWSSAKRRILLIYEFIDTEDIESGRLLSATQGNLLNNLVKLAQDYSGIRMPEIAAINFDYFRCRHLPQNLQEVASRVSVSRIRKYINKVKPTDIFVFGRMASTYLEDIEERDAFFYQGRPIKRDDGIWWTRGPNLSAAYQSKKDIEEAEESQKVANLAGFLSKCLGNALARKPVYNIQFKPNTKLVDTIDKWKKLFDVLMRVDAFSFDSETVDLSRKHPTVLFMQFAFSSKVAYVVPVEHQDSPFSEEEVLIIRRDMRKLFGKKFDTLSYDPNKFMLGQNLKFDLTVFREWLKLQVIQWPIWDLMAGEYLLDENLIGNRLGKRVGSFSLEWITKWYGCDFYSENAFGKQDRMNIANVPIDEPGLIDYCGADATIPWLIYEKQLERSKKLINGKMYTESYKKMMLLQMSNIIHIQSMMEHRGDFLDIKWLKSLLLANGPLDQIKKKLTEVFISLPSVKAVNTKLLKAAGIPQDSLFGDVNWIFSLSKPSHKHALFFDELGLEPVSYGKTGPSIDKEFQEVYKKIPEVEAFKNLAQVDKVKSTYVVGFLRKLQEDKDMSDHRLRPNFGYLDTVTGRPNSSDPNLQNIIQRGPLAKVIKRAFVAPKNGITIKFDYCVAGNSLIPTNNGLVRLDSLATKKPYVKTEIQTKVKSIKGDNVAVFATYMGKKETIALKTKSGNYIRVTPEHKMLVFRQGTFSWVEAKHCVLGDNLCLSNFELVRRTKLPLTLSSLGVQANNSSGYNNVYKYSTYKYLVKIKIPNTKKYYKVIGFNNIKDAVKARDLWCASRDIKTSSMSFAKIQKPKIMTPDLAWLLGAIVSEGWIDTNSNNVSFSNSNRKLIKRYIDSFYRVFGVKPSYRIAHKAGDNRLYNGVIYNNNYDHLVVRIRSKQLVVWLKELGIYTQIGRKNGKTASHFKHVPWSVLEADKESQLGFLSAYLECDGHIQQNKSLNWSSASIKLLRGMQAILNSYGLYTTFSKTKTVTQLRLSVEDSIKIWGSGLNKLSISKKLKGCVEKSSSMGKLPTLQKNDMSEAQLQEYNSYNVSISPIVSIKEGGLTDVFDLTMKDQKRPAFVANGLIVHNCAHEVRMWAIESSDLLLCQLFVNGRWLRQQYRKTGNPIFKELMDTVGDIHKLNCNFFFEIPVDKVTPEQRDSIKRVVFGSIYGRGAASIAKQAKQAKDLIANLMKRFFKRFTKGANYLDSQKKAAVTKGYTVSKIGRVRNIFSHLFGLDNLSAGAERRGANAPIQGISSDLGQTAGYLYDVHLNQYVEKFKLRKGRFDSGTVSFVHDAVKTVAELDLALASLQILQWCATIGVCEYYTKHFGVKFYVEPEIEFEIGASDDTLVKWDWHENTLLEIMKKAFVKHGEIHGTDPEELEAKLYEIRRNPKYKEQREYLDKHYPILSDWKDAIHIDTNSKDFKNGLGKTLREKGVKL